MRVVAVMAGVALIMGVSPCAPAHLATATAAGAPSATVRQCEALATQSPTALSTAYIGQLLDPHEVQTVARLPGIGARCVAAGQRSFVLKDIQLQQERTQTSGFGTGTRVWRSALARPLTLATGDGELRVTRSVTTTLKLYCYRSAATADGVNEARAIYLLAFRPRDRHERAASRLLTRTVSYRLGYC